MYKALLFIASFKAGVFFSLLICSIPLSRSSYSSQAVLFVNIVACWSFRTSILLILLSNIGSLFIACALNYFSTPEIDYKKCIEQCHALIRTGKCRKYLSKLKYGELLDVGYSISDILSLGYSVKKLSSQGLRIGECKAQVPVTKLVDAYSAYEILKEGISIESLGKALHKKGRRMRDSVFELVNSGCSMYELKQFGISAAELNDTGCVDLKMLKPW